MDGPESFSPSEGGASGGEALSEEAKQRFAGASQAIQQIRKDEKKAKKRDDGVAQVILQFLTDEQKTHLATLIARLVAINCPSHFILALLSLINEQCANAVADYLKDQEGQELSAASTALLPTGQLDAASTQALADWMGRINGVLSLDADTILRAIIVEERNIDGTVLQLTTFVLQEFLTEHGKDGAFEQLQGVSAAMLQSILTPHMQGHLARRLSESPKDE